MSCPPARTLVRSLAHSSIWWYIIIIIINMVLLLWRGTPTASRCTILVVFVQYSCRTVSVSRITKDIVMSLVVSSSYPRLRRRWILTPHHGQEVKKAQQINTGMYSTEQSVISSPATIISSSKRLDAGTITIFFRLVVTAVAS